jgi:dTDP-4-dehydrorhamnose reductase
MNNILITGSGGFIGSYVYHSLSEAGFVVYGIDRIIKPTVDEVVDLTKQDDLLNVLNSQKPDVIIHLAAYSNVEMCESDHLRCFNNNVLPTALMTNWAWHSGARVIFISSDYVFNGDKGNYCEEDVEQPLQNYGVTKLIGEKIVSTLSNSVILRPTVVYGWDIDGMNFFMQLYRSQLEKKEKRIPIDQISNPTYVGDLCELIKKLVENSSVSGTYLATGNESFNRYEFAKHISDNMNWDENILQPVKTEYFGQIAKRPLNNSTNSSKICDILEFSFGSLDDNLIKIKSLMNV